MTAALQQMIRQYEQKGDFTYATVHEDNLRKAEEDLGVQIPKQYADFLTLYGHGGIGGIEILGFGKNGAMLFVQETQQYRNYGLASKYIVIENCDEWVNCLNCEDGTVVAWNQSFFDPVAACFDDFLMGRMKDAIENL